MVRPKIAKDWYKDGAEPLAEQARMLLLIEQAKVTKAEELPQFLSAKEAAPILKVHYKTSCAWLKDGTVRSVKVRGRRYTTPEWIQEFFRSEMRKRG